MSASRKRVRTALPNEPVPPVMRRTFLKNIPAASISIKIKYHSLFQKNFDDRSIGYIRVTHASAGRVDVSSIRFRCFFHVTAGISRVVSFINYKDTH